MVFNTLNIRLDVLKKKLLKPFFVLYVIQVYKLPYQPVCLSNSFFIMHINEQRKNIFDSAIEKKIVKHTHTQI